MNRDLTFFEQLPIIGPRNSFWEEQERQMNNIISGMNKLFKDEFNSVYPYDIYNKIVDGKKVSTIIELAAAGFTKEDCLITIKGNILSLTLQKKDKNKKDDKVSKEYIQKKIAYRTMKLSWTLSDACDKDNIQVTYKNGILMIEMPLIQKVQVQPEQKTLTIK